MKLQKISYDIVDGIAVIAMNYAENINAIDEEMADELIFSLDQAEKDAAVKVIVLKGLPKAFSAGGDIGYFYKLIEAGDSVNIDDLNVKVDQIAVAIKKSSKMMIASVSGAAAGAGASLALAADFIVCADNAKFIMAFVNLGLVPDTGGAYLLARQLGEKRAMELCATGRPLSAEEAKELGIVYKVVPKEALDTETMALAHQLTKGPLLSYKNIKREIYAASFNDYQRFLEEAEVPAQHECAASADFKEGVRAFIEKRKAQFKGEAPAPDNWKAAYDAKFMDVKDAAGLIESGDVLWVGAFCDNPIQMLDALADRKDELENVEVINCLACQPHRYMSGEFKGHLNGHSFFFGPVERKMFKEGNTAVNSVHFSQSGPAMRDEYHVNTLFVEVSEPDEDGNMYYGPIGVAWDGMVAEYATKKIVQINKYQGKVRGKNSYINVRNVDAICRCDHPLAELKQPPVTEIDEKIASYIVPYIKDGCTLQVGLGGIANAIAYSLVDRKHIGVHTEMLTDSMAYLYKKGVIDGDRVLGGFGLGSNEVYDWCKSGVPELGDISYVNIPSVAGAKDNFVSINSCLMVDLTGQVGSESIGHKQFSCTGGQLDYVLAASISKGGQSFLCLKSINEKKDGTVSSTISLTLPPGQAVTTPRSCVMYVVTEYGVADLYNKPIKERAKALIAIAHPDFREQLTKEAKAAGLIPEDE